MKLQDRTHRKEYIRIAVALAAAALFCALYFLIDPEASSWVPQCVFHRLTGLKCPGCGSQRMLHALLHGDIAAAWHHNAMLLCLLPLLIPMILIELAPSRWPRIYARLHSVPVMISLLVLLILWSFLRNFA